MNSFWREKEQFLNEQLFFSKIIFEETLFEQTTNPEVYNHRTMAKLITLNIACKNVVLEKVYKTSSKIS